MRAISGMRPIYPTRGLLSKHMLSILLARPMPHPNGYWIRVPPIMSPMILTISHLFFNYDGHDTLQIDNGAGLPILHISSSQLLFSTHTISLQNILHVSQFSKNLISLSKLLQDNPHLLITFSFFLLLF